MEKSSSKDIPQNFITQQQSLDNGSWDETQPAHTSCDQLERGLKPRHLTMIALGGALGTGLLIGTGSALTKAGPAGIFIDYTIIGCVVFLVMTALGEMISFMPLAHGFGGYATRFVDPALGFATGYVYWFKYLLATPNQLAAASLIMKFWVGDRVNPAVFIAIMLVLIVCINWISVKAFGEFEFWLSAIKVVVIVGVILLLIVLALGGGPTGDRPGFRYWSNPGAFAEYKVKGDMGKFLGVWSAMVSAVYAFGGTELIGVTVGEAQNPRVVMPKAVKMTFFRIAFFYIFSVFFLGMVVPYNSKLLVFATKSSTSAAASPFVVAITLSKIGGLDHVVNGCLLVFVFSAANSDLYIASRTIYGIAIDGKAPAIFTKTNNRGIPYVALGVSASFCLLAFMSINAGAKVVFGYLTNMVAVFGMLTWISVLTTHICFRKACKVQQVPHSQLPYRAPFGIWGSSIALAFMSILIVFKGAEVFVHGFDYKNFIVQYIGIPVYLICIFGYKFIKRSVRVRANFADLVTGVPTETVEDEKARLRAIREKEDAELGASGSVFKKFYKNVLSWLF